MLKTLINAWKVPELRKKIIFTLCMFVVLRLGAVITVPGINQDVLQSLFNNGSNNIFGLMDIIAGGAFKTMALFAFGVGPYITASIVVQLLQMAITKLEELSKEGETGRKKINKYTRYVALGLAILQAAATTLTLFNNNALRDKSVWTFLLVMLSLVAGTMLVMWIGEQITQRGVGNGTSLIIFINIVSRLPQQFQSLFITKNYAMIPVVLIIGIVLVAFVVLMSQGERRIAVQYAKRTTGRKVYTGGQSQHIPIKVNLAGVMPVIFAMSILQFPQIVTGFFTSTPAGVWGTIIKNLNWTTPIGGTLYIVLIFAFTFFYSTVAFNPLEIASNMKKNGGFVPGIRPGKPTSDYLSNIATYITLLGAICLAVLAIVPILLTTLLNIPLAFSGTSLLILVGVALETIKQLESQMLMRHYRGFL